MKTQTNRRVWGTWMGGALANLVLIGTITGCAVTQKQSVQRMGASAVGGGRTAPMASATGPSRR